MTAQRGRPDGPGTADGGEDQQDSGELREFLDQGCGNTRERDIADATRWRCWPGEPRGRHSLAREGSQAVGPMAHSMPNAIQPHGAPRLRAARPRITQPGDVTRAARRKTGRRTSSR